MAALFQNRRVRSEGPSLLIRPKIRKSLTKANSTSFFLSPRLTAFVGGEPLN